MTEGQRRQWLGVLRAEFDRIKTGQTDDPLARTLEILEEMAEQMRDDPNFRELTLKESAENLAWIEAWCKHHGYGGR